MKRKIITKESLAVFWENKILLFRITGLVLFVYSIIIFPYVNLKDGYKYNFKKYCKEFKEITLDYALTKII